MYACMQVYVYVWAYACKYASVYGRMDIGVYGDIATHMLVRGPIVHLSYGWIGCTSDDERPEALK